MKNFFLLFIIIGSISSFAADKSAFVIYDAKGKKSSFKKILKATEGKNFIFFGEYHDNPISHWLQLELTRELFGMYKNDLVLGAEMFEADNQFILDEYLDDLISSKNFQEEVRLWPNYNTDYKPLVEYAKKNKIPFVATNVPRRYANMVFKKGIESLDELSELAKSYIAPLEKFEFDSTVKCYRNMITGMGDHGSPNLAKAQALKDATMAYFMVKNSTINSVFLHYNGAYHSDNYQGIVHYLKKEVEEERILTITTISQENIYELKSKHKETADFIICVPENMTSTH
jgi:uncharacterized iron-regulated protein